MFEALRKMILPIIIIVLVFFMGMIVLQWGLDITGRQKFAQANEAGIVNGEPISWNTYQQVYSNLYQAESKKSEGEISDARLEELEESAWNQVVADKLLMQQAEKHNVMVTEDDLYLYLRFNPPTWLQELSSFQTDGHFDYQKYVNLMADPSAASFWATIEPQVRTELKAIKLQQLILEAVHMSESEVRQAFLDSEENVKVGAVVVRKSRFSSVVPKATDEECEAYFNEHRNDYTVDERAILNIVKVDKEPSELDNHNALVLANELRDSVLAGEDFAGLAERWSEDPGSASKGGDLGWFAQGRMVHEFDSAAFAMKEGEISPPIKTQFGYHIIKHLGYKTDVDTSPRASDKNKKVKQAHAAHILIKVRPSMETLDQLWSRMNDFIQLAQTDGFEAAATALELEVLTTDPIAAKDRISYFRGGAPKIVEWAFNNKAGDISDVIDLSESYCVARVDQRLPAGLAEFEDVRAEVYQEISQQRMGMICHDTTAQVYEEIQKGTNIKKAAEKYGFKYDEVGPFSRSSRVVQLSSDPVIIGAAFGLNETGEISEPIEYSGGMAILKLLEHTSPDLTSFNEKRDSVYNSALLTKQQEAYSKWFQNLHANAQIQSNIGWQRRQR